MVRADRALERARLGLAALVAREVTPEAEVDEYLAATEGTTTTTVRSDASQASIRCKAIPL